MQIKAGKYVLASGPLPRDAEFSLVGEKQTPLCKFGLKADEEGEGDNKRVSWINCVCWGTVAHVAASLQKGNIAFCIGQLKTRTYIGRDGDKHTATELVCEFVCPMADASMENSRAPIPPQPTFEDLDDDGDLPF